MAGTGRSGMLHECGVLILFDAVAVLFAAYISGRWYTDKYERWIVYSLVYNMLLTESLKFQIK